MVGGLGEPSLCLFVLPGEHLGLQVWRRLCDDGSLGSRRAGERRCPSLRRRLLRSRLRPRVVGEAA